MQSFLILLTAIIFYLLGRYAGQEKETLLQVSKTLKKRLFPSKPGIISYPSPAELKYRTSEEKKIEEEWDKNFGGMQ